MQTSISKLCIHGRARSLRERRASGYTNLMGQPSLDRDYFARIYAATPDPWNFAASPYENEKYRATIAALGGQRFGAGFEIGCSVGVLTAMLARACDSLLSIDINERALEAARARCADVLNVQFALMAFPRETPAAARFDLIVVSEVAYYLSDDDLRAAIDFCAAAAAGGIVELVHFLPKVEDYVRDGDAVHEAFLRDRRFAPVHQTRAEKYRIDVLRAR
jgi:SAM-dependent methyltransferase